MKKLISSLILIGAMGALGAQSLSPEVVANAGETYAAGNLVVEWTLGEVMTESYDGTLILTQGFHQPELQVTSIKDPAAAFGFVKVYPNPTAGSISIEREQAGDLHMNLLDMQGRLIMQEHASTSLTSLDMSSLPTGIYVLRLSDGKQGVRSIRIEKR